MFANPIQWLSSKRGKENSLRKSFDDIAKVGIRGDAVFDIEDEEPIDTGRSFYGHRSKEIVEEKSDASSLSSSSSSSPPPSFWDRQAEAAAERSTEDFSSGYEYPVEHAEGSFPQNNFGRETNGNNFDKENDNAQFGSPRARDMNGNKMFPMKAQSVFGEVQLNSEAEDTIEYVFSKLRHNRAASVKEALQNGFNVQTTDSKGNSLLHICAQNDNKKMAALIIRLGCPVNGENKKGMTPLDYAQLYKFAPLEDLLREAGGVNGSAQRKSILGDSRF